VKGASPWIGQVFELGGFLEGGNAYQFFILEIISLLMIIFLHIFAYVEP
jgi:hypothetical protein